VATVRADASKRGEVGSADGAAGQAQPLQPVEGNAHGGEIGDGWPEVVDAEGMEWPVIGRCWWASMLNLVLPGAGLIALQREKVGCLVLAGFAVAAEAGLVGVLVAPAAVGLWWTVGALVFAAACWVAGQVLLLRRVGEIADGKARSEAARLILAGREAILAGNWSEARRLLAGAARYDDEQPELNYLLGRLKSIVGRSDEAARQWKRLRQVDRSGRYRAEWEQYLRVGGETGKAAERSEEEET